MNEKQKTLEKGMEENRNHYRHICSNTGVGFLNLLNQEYEEGFRVFGDIEKTEQTDAETGVRYLKRSAYLYNTEDTGLNSDEKTKRIKIVDAVDMAENHLYRKKSLLEDKENYLLLNTDWKTLNLIRDGKGQTKITNDKLRSAFVNEDKDYATLKLEVQEASQWLKLVKKYAELHELPVGKSPWELEEEKATIEDEKASEVYTKRVGAEEGGING